MKPTKKVTLKKRYLATIFTQQPKVEAICKKIKQAGGTALLVGGAVRDLLLPLPLKDIDIEVHGLSAKKLETLLKEFGPVDLVGKTFGVFRIHGLDVDWSLPRADEPGRKPKVAIDPFMDYTKAFARRDLTINAMGIDMNTGQLIDPFGGQKDLQKKILRAPDKKFFQEDPLRFFRVMQFIGRFEFKPDAQLNKICKKMDLSTVSKERIEQEFKKLFLKSKNPSLGIRWIAQLGKLKELFPELAALHKVPQPRDWHPEGDVFEHTMQALDAAARIKYKDEQTKLIALYAVLCHDLGKAKTTKKIKGRWHAYRHEIEGVPLAKKFLKRITNNKIIIDAVAKLVKYHLVPGQFTEAGAKPSAYKRLAKKLAPEVTLELLAQVALADKQGRNSKSSKPLSKKIPEITEFLKKAQEAHVLERVEKPILHGRDLLGKIKPGPQMGVLLNKAYEIQLDEGITNKQELLKRILKKSK